jgi:hypothetical protein
MNSLCDWFIDAHLIVERQQRLLHEATCMTCLPAHGGQGDYAAHAGHRRQWLRSRLSARIVAAVWWSPRPPPQGPHRLGPSHLGRPGR